MPFSNNTLAALTSASTVVPFQLFKTRERVFGITGLWLGSCYTKSQINQKQCTINYKKRLQNLPKSQDPSANNIGPSSRVIKKGRLAFSDRVLEAVGSIFPRRNQSASLNAFRYIWNPGVLETLVRIFGVQPERFQALAKGQQASKFQH